MLAFSHQCGAAHLEALLLQGLEVFLTVFLFVVIDVRSAASMKCKMHGIELNERNWIA